MSPPALTESTLLPAVDQLAAADPDLAAVVARFGPPPLWARPQGFSTLVLLILEQQVSLASARATYDRLVAATSALQQTSPTPSAAHVAAPPPAAPPTPFPQITPTSLLQLDDATLRTIGFSRQKTAYTRHLAAAIVAGRFNPHALAALDDDAARAALVSLKGIGPWTAEVYLLMALGRPDAWPHHDLGLLVAAQEVKALPQRPTPPALAELAEPWRPYRAVAARILWHHYLSTRARKP